MQSTKWAVAAMALLAVGLSAGTAQAVFISTIFESGSDVVANGSGTIDLTGLTSNGAAIQTDSGIVPDSGAIVLGGVPANSDIYTGLTGPANFGGGGLTLADSSSGDLVGLSAASGNLLGLPLGYNSGDALSASATWNNTDFATLGLTTGIYTWSWGTGDHADSFILGVGETPTPPPPPTTFTTTIVESGSNVVATGSGTIDLTGLSFSGSAIQPDAAVLPGSGAILVGAAPAETDVYTGFTGPASFGSGGLTLADASSGDFVGLSLVASDDLLALPLGYNSDEALSSTAIWNNTDFATLGLTTGTYTWSWGGGGHGGSYVLRIGEPAVASGVPEPTTFALFGVGLAGLGFMRRKLTA